VKRLKPNATIQANERRGRGTKNAGGAPITKRMMVSCGAENLSRPYLIGDECKAPNDRNESAQGHIARGQRSHFDELTATPES
jgi:hypothetical protein